MRRGETREFPAETAQNRHLWGARLQNWQPEMPKKLMEETHEDSTLVPIALKLLQCFPEQK